MKKCPFLLLIACLAFMLCARLAGAQTSDLQLLLSKDMGFAFGSQIQGSFSLSVAGPADMTSATYSIDGREMATVKQSPFRYAFTTDSYAIGQHQFMATATTAGGQMLKSNVIDVEIVSPSAGLQASTRIIVPIVAIVFVIIAAMFAVQFLPRGSNKRRIEIAGAGAGTVVQDYGIAGGAICPKCGRPFARSIFGLNLLSGKLDRCPHCGKWSITHRASSEALLAAEQSEAQAATSAVPEQTADELLRQQIEDSRLSR
jgi:ribosomal protein L32